MPDASFTRLAGISGLSLVLIGFPHAGAAQSVMGQVVEEGTAAPLVGVLVSLVREDGSRAATVLTDSLGSFAVRAEPGRYQLVAERIGLADATSGWIDVEASDVVRERLEMRDRAIQLAGLRVDSRVQECRVDPVSGVTLQRWWDEARKALDATALIAASPGVRFSVGHFEREWSRDLRSLRREEASRRTSYAPRPFVSLDAQSLASDGYVQGASGSRQFFAPDAEVLLSDSFLAQHCFAIATDSPELDWVGLRFEPTRSRTAVDILGVLWVDTLAATLKQLDYSYANLPDDLPGEAAGGRVEFARLPDGAWIVSEWWIRMPRVGVRQERTALGSRAVHEVTGYVDVGGVVQGFEARGRSARRPSDVGTIRGTVTDSLIGRPLAQARVVVSGTALSAITSADGSFVIHDVPAGPQQVAFFHAGLSEMGLPAPVVELDVPGSDTVQVSLVTPGFEGMVRHLCADPSEVRAVLVGRLAGDADRPRVDVAVRATWREGTVGSPLERERWAETYANSTGRYVFCDLPSDSLIEVAVRNGAAWYPAYATSLARGEIQFRPAS